MGVLRVDHPDIMSFITCKQHDFALKHQLREDIFGHYDQIKDTLGPHAKILLDKFLSNFNISVLVTSKFMKAVEADADFDLCFNGKTYRTIKALEIFNAVVRNAWRNGDPGMLFYEAMNNGPYKYSGQELTATNPCVTGESLVPTQFGWRRVDLLKVGDLIFTQGKLSPITRIEVNKDCHVFRVEFSDGGYVNATAAHRFKCVVNKQYKYLRLDEIGVGTKVLVENPSIGLMNQNPEWGEFVPVGDLKIAARDYGLIVGTVLGDGCFVDRNTNKNHVDISFSQQEQDWRSLFCAILAKYEIGYYLEDGQSTVRVRSNYLTPILERCGLERNRAPNKTIPADIFNCNNTEIIAGLLDGLFSTDGNMYLKKDNPMLRLSSSSLEMLRQVRLMLLSIGVHAKIYKSDRKPHDIDGRQISTQNPKYDLVIMNVGISKFHEFTKLSNQRKRDRIEECVKSYHYTGDNRWASIVNISETEHPETVYDVYVEDTDEWNVHGYVQQGCGEQMLPPFGSCNLGSIDVSKYYNPQKRDVDWRRLRADIRTAFRFLDCVIDINVFPTSEFAQWAKENRPVGLGIMGFADLLLKLRLSYGSPKSIEFAEKLIRFFRHESHKMSVELGQEKGTPKSCQFKELDFRRNATTLSIAPTGSISLLAGCSSSIEPVFAPMTYRYDNTGSYAMPHPESDKPYFRCALDKEGKGKREIKWQEHVAMQIAFQKHVDSGISKTINMPNSATEQDIAAAYLMAWKGGCKGLTIYRDGCKSAQVLNTKEKGSVRLGSNNAVERPATVPCDIFRATANGIEWHIIVGKVDNVPYELFAINGKHGSIPPTGYIVRNASRDYSLLNDDKSVLLPNIIEIQEDIDPRISLETRRFSLELRHGIHPKFITQQIDKSSETLTSFCKVVGRIFKHKYISDEEFIETLRKEDRVCPECKGTLISEACCVKCSNSDCSYSKCG
jgi:ribonucleoside-diphosphate reductase alpha chain